MKGTYFQPCFYTGTCLHSNTYSIYIYFWYRVLLEVWYETLFLKLLCLLFTLRAFKVNRSLKHTSCLALIKDTLFSFYQPELIFSFYFFLNDKICTVDFEFSCFEKVSLCIWVARYIHFGQQLLISCFHPNPPHRQQVFFLSFNVIVNRSSFISFCNFKKISTKLQHDSC